MQDILNTINHTTLEALGFNNMSYAGQSVPNNTKGLSTDVFCLGPLKAVVYDDGEVMISLHDRPINIDLAELKGIITYLPK
jgi:hypothetical protein